MTVTAKITAFVTVIGIFLAVACSKTVYAMNDNRNFDIVAISACEGSDIHLNKLINKESKREELAFYGINQTEALRAALEDSFSEGIDFGLQGCVSKSNRETHFFSYIIDESETDKPRIISAGVILIDGRPLGIMKNSDWLGYAGKAPTTPYEAALSGALTDISDDPEWFKEMTTLRIRPADAD